MKRGSKAGGKSHKARRREAAAKRSNAKGARRRPSAVNQKAGIARFRRELYDAHEQQAATAEVLRIIASSAGDLPAVLDTLVESATRLCEAERAAIFFPRGQDYELAASYGHTEESRKYLGGRSINPRGSLVGRVLLHGKTVHIPDVATDAEYAMGKSRRTLLGVPLLRQQTVVGVFALARSVVRPFNSSQIDLVTTFANQAVIAIENARLLNELHESLQQQTATADVLKVISRSTFDLQTVLDTLVESATRSCEAYDTVIFMCEGERLHAKAHHGPIPMDLVDWPIGPGWVTGRAVWGRQTVHIEDLQASADEFPDGAAMARRMGHRTILSIPLMREDNAIGAITIRRTDVRPFSNKQVELVKTFADQAVIAIENARLLNELRQSLERQTATAEVLQVINSSAGSLTPVFEAMLDKAMQLCEAAFGGIWTLDGDRYTAVALQGVPEPYAAFLAGTTLVPGPGTAPYRLMRGESFVHNVDLKSEEPYQRGDPQRRALVDLGGARTALQAALRKDDTVLGIITIYRQEVRPYSEKQIELLQNFASQAVIAIENARLLSELREALQQQTATSEVLRVISSSPSDLAPVFQTMLANANRLCDATFGLLLLYEGGWRFRVVAMSNVPPAFAELHQREPIFEVSRETGLGRAVATKDVVHIADYAEEAIYKKQQHPAAIALGKLGRARTYLVVPMLKDKEIAGAIAIYRQQVRPFADKQIELVKSFAAQAVIAIENTRLLNELRQRTDDLTESLEQQTATSKVLEVISSSPGDLKPVFEAILANAVRLCGAKFGNLYLREGDGLRAAAMHNAPPAYAEQRAGILHPSPNTTSYRAIQTKQPAQIADITKLQAYVEGDPWLTSAVSLGGHRGALSVPMLRDDDLIGVITIFRQEAEAFADKQIELLANFAKQAVIAIENARLLNELRQSLEQQTATSEVLRVISSSPTNVQPVFDSIAESAVRLCGGQFSFVVRYDGKLMHFASSFGLSAEGLDVFRSMMPMPASEETAAGRAIFHRAVVEVADVKADHAYGTQAQDLARANTYRSIAAVPLLHEGSPIGAVAVARANAGSFPERQIALLQAFADQAVIAIRNVRLFDEVRARTEELSESLQQQTATADVLKVISRSAFDLQIVLHTLVESATRLCEADKGTITRQRGNAFYRAEAYGFSAEFMDYVKDIPITPDRGTASGRALLEGRVIHIADVKNDPDYMWVEAQKLGDYRTILAVPMLREGMPIGVLVLTRSEVRPFTDKQIELVTTFADQASIAIENVRLFDEIQEKSKQLEEASQHKSQFLANMSHELRTPLNAILGYTELMADGAYGEPSEKMSAVLKRLESNGRHLLGLINDVLDLSKIEAGQLALELSEYSIQDIAQTVRSTLESLAADKKLGFKVEVASRLPSGRGDGRRLTQVLINLVGNAIKFTDTGEVAIKAEASNGSFYVSVRDTGPGISAADQAKLFQEFQQADNAITKKKGGTGLGLAISKRIVEMHGGRIWIDSTVGEGSTFSFTVPVRVERQVEAAMGAQ